MPPRSVPATETEYSSLIRWSDGARQFKIPVKTSARQDKQKELEELRAQDQQEIKVLKKVLQLKVKSMDKIAASLVLL